MEIARSSGCEAEGGLTDSYRYNEYTGTYWIEMDAEKEGCSPACVVDVQSLEAEINWRCTGAMPEPYISEREGVEEGVPVSAPHGGDPDMVIGVTGIAEQAPVTAQVQAESAAETNAASVLGPLDAIVQAFVSFFQGLFGG